MAGESDAGGVNGWRHFRLAERAAGFGYWRTTFVDGKMFWSEGLYRLMGIEPGSRVAAIGDGFTEEYWARLDRAEIVAEVPRTLNTGDSEAAFWSSGIEGEQAVLDALKSTGAMAAVADLPPKVLPPGWVPVGKTGRAVYFFH